MLNPDNIQNSSLHPGIKDALWVVLALLFIGWSYYFYWSAKATQHQGHTADIIVNHKTITQISLHHNKTYKVKGPLGTSIIEVNSNRIRFKQSPCNKKYCVLSGWHQLSGDIAACVPNHIVVRVNGTPHGYDMLNH